MAFQGSWERRNYETPDGRLVQAEREVFRNFRDKVSVDRKAKSLTKFGKSAALTTGSLQTVWTVGGNETYLDDNLITHISSSSASDSETITIEGHTVSGTGADQKFTFVAQIITLNGQNKVALTTPLARVSRAFNSNSVDLSGRVVVYEDTAITNGVPSDVSKIHIDIPQGLQQSFKAATTFSDKDYLFLTSGFGSVSNKQAASVDFYLEVKLPGGVFRQQTAISASSTGGAFSIELNPCVIVPRNSDIRVRAETGTNGATVFTNFQGYIAETIG